MTTTTPPPQGSPQKRDDETVRGEREEEPQVLPSSQPQQQQPEQREPIPQEEEVTMKMVMMTAAEQQNHARNRIQVKTPEPRASKDRMNGQKDPAERSPSTPGHLPPFDWDEFETRYKQALEDADRDEQQLLEEFDQLVKYFNIWASAASVHDNERANKRLQTRERYVRIAEHGLQQKKLHLGEVVRAFQSALALLSQSQT